MREAVASSRPLLNGRLQQKETQGRRRRVLPERASHQVIVNHPDRLHRRVDRRRADEDEAAPLELLRERLRFGGGRLEVRSRPGGRPFVVRRVGPDQLVEGLAPGVQLPRRLRVRDCRLDLAAVADDSLVREQPAHVPRPVLRDLLDLEPVEGAAEVLPLAQDGQPGEPRLKCLERQPLEELVLAVQRPTPFAVVVVEVVGSAQGPGTARLAIGSRLDAGHG